MDSTIKSAAKVAELNQLNENRNAKRKGFQNIRANKENPQRKKKGTAASCMASIIEVWTDSLLAKKTRFYGCRGEI
jgi:hypothetical protein